MWSQASLKKTLRSRLTACALAGAIAYGGSSQGAAESLSAKAACDALVGKVLGGGAVSKASLVAAAGGMPEYCAVSGNIAGSSINFAVRLPSKWNGKARMGAVGGWQGSISAPGLQWATLENALAKGYVDYATDAGHVSHFFDVSWAGNPEALSNFASLSYQRVTLAARAITRKRYGKEPQRIYFEGCSGGGRIALVMAQRFPSLFDGIIAGGPAPNFIGTFLGWQRPAQALAVPGATITPAKLRTLSKAVMDECDSDDGLVDGIVSNALSCSYDPEALRCARGVDNDSCLTGPQMDVVKAMTADTVFEDGSLLVKGLRLLGAEDDPANWQSWSNPIANTSDPRPHAPAKASMFEQGAASMIRVLTRDPAADALAYSVAEDQANIRNLSYLIDAWPGHLSEFGAAGNKLIMWIGTQDTPVPFDNQIVYYKSALASLGGPENAANTVKLYLLPGVNHCGGGQGAGTFDYLQALDEWVSKNIAPDGKEVLKLNDAGKATLSRPLCAYPTYPRYNGSGNVNAASSFSCTPGPAE